MGLPFSKLGPTTAEEEKRLAEAKQYVKNHGFRDVDNFYKDQITSWKNVELHFAIIGTSESGKTSFINAIKGLKAHVVGAAETGAEGTTTVRHPNNEKINLTELPSYAVENLDYKKYDKNIGGMEKYDAFLVFYQKKLTNSDKKVVEKISKVLRKPFLCVRTHFDFDDDHKESEKILRKIKKECLESLEIKKERLVNDMMDIYVINNRFTDKYDFYRLVEDINSKLVERRRECFISSLNIAIYGTGASTEEQNRLEQARQYVANHGVAGIDDFYKYQKEVLGDKELHFAVTGDSGTGKSSFINTMRGLKAYEDGAAPVGLEETTAVPTKYPHPDNEKITFWDLPGIGTTTHKDLKKYLADVGGVKKYDAFLIFCAKRFTNYDGELAKAMEELGKPFFFVRTHIAADLNNAEDDEGPKFCEQSAKERVREDCWENLKHLLKDKKNIYLIDNKAKNEYDFDRLLEDIELALPQRHKECFVLSLRNVTRNSLKRKAKWLKVRAATLAFCSACVSSAPVPGLGPTINMVLIWQEITMYRHRFGFPTLESVTKLDADLMTRVIKYVFTSVLDLLGAMAHCMAELGVEEAVKYIPGPGTLVSCAITLASVFHLLYECIEHLEEVALEVWDRASS